MLARLRKAILDVLIPPFRAPFEGGPAFVAYSRQKNTLIDGKLICPLVEPYMMSKCLPVRTYVSLGPLAGVQSVPSHILLNSLRPMEFVFSLFIPRRSDLVDLRFMLRLYTLQLSFPFKTPRLHAFRTYILARYFTFKFRELASVCDRVYVVGYYSASMLGVIGAFKALGKPAWDVQHGYLGSNHDAYNNPAAYSLSSRLRPDGFVVWDERFGDYVSRTLGTPYESTGYAHLLASPRRVSDRSRPITILYTLQWETALPDEVAAAVRRHADVSWQFRLHPMELSQRDDLAWIRESPNATITDSTEPLPSVLRTCDLHMTYNSSVVHEAAALGVSSLFLDPEVKARFAHEVAEGRARFVGEGELEGALNDALARITRDRAAEPDPVTARYS